MWLYWYYSKPPSTDKLNRLRGKNKPTFCIGTMHLYISARSWALNSWNSQGIFPRELSMLVYFLIMRLSRFPRCVHLFPQFSFLSYTVGIWCSFRSKASCFGFGNPKLLFDPLYPWLFYLSADFPQYYILMYPMLFKLPYLKVSTVHSPEK